MTFKVRDGQFSCFLDWLIRYIHFPADDAFEAYSFLKYQKCLVYKSVQIHMKQNEICLNLTGTGCRTIEELNEGWNWFDWLYLFHESITTKDSSMGLYTVHISRLDVALDKIDDKKVTFEKLSRYTLKRCFICKSQYYEVDLGNRKNMIYFGSPDSDRFIRIYDKAMEQKISDGLIWLRYEFQLRDDNATSFYLNLVQAKGDFVKVYFGMLRDFLRYITTPNDVDHHQDRKVTCKWWLNFLGEGERIKQLYLPGEKYDLGRAVKYYTKQCASTVKAITDAYDGDITPLLEIATSAKLNKKQRDMLADWEKQKDKKDDIPVDDLTSRPAAFNATEAKIMYEVQKENARRELVESNWRWGTPKEREGYENSKRILEALAAKDLPFD